MEINFCSGTASHGQLIPARRSSNSPAMGPNAARNKRKNDFGKRPSWNLRRNDMLDEAQRIHLPEEFSVRLRYARVSLCQGNERL